MKTTRNVLGLALIVVAGTAVSANPVNSHERIDAQPMSAPVDGLRTARAIGAQSSGVRQNVVYAYNTLDCHPDFDCTLGMNIAMNGSGLIYILPMGHHLPPGDDTPLDPWDVLPYHAQGFEVDGAIWMLDVYIDDYEADAGVWGDIDELQPMVAFTGICWTFGNFPGMEYRVHGFTYSWMDQMGEEWFGGWRWEPDVDAGESWLYTLTAGEIDYPLDPADTFQIPYAGLLLFDYDNITVNGLTDLGAWSVFLGGDLEDVAFPYPTDLYLVGYNDPEWWVAGFVDGWPDGMTIPDLIDDGHLIQIQWASDTGLLPQGHPTKFAIPGGGCLGDVTGDGKTGHADLAACLAAWMIPPGHPGWNPDCDLTGDGMFGHADLAILLADYGCGT